MRIKCSQCERDLNIPDEKLPNAPKFKVKCPHCRTEIVVSRGARDQGSSALGRTSSVPYSTMEPEVFPPGAKVVCLAMANKQWKENSEEFFKANGYYISRSSSADEAVLKLRLNEYDIVVVEETPENEVVLEEIATWTGLRRRRINLVLVGDQAASLDPQMAFRRSVNVYFNKNEALRAEDLFNNAIKGFEIYYRWFAQVQDGA